MSERLSLLFSKHIGNIALLVVAFLIFRGFYFFAYGYALGLTIAFFGMVMLIQTVKSGAFEKTVLGTPLEIQVKSFADIKLNYFVYSLVFVALVVAGHYIIATFHFSTLLLTAYCKELITKKFS